MSGGKRYSRPLPTLPDPYSLPFPARQIRLCTDCHLCRTCRAPVPGDNIEPLRIMLVGQNPGRHEDERGIPFCGMSGRYLDSLLFGIGVHREDVAISNVLKCATQGNRTPKIGEIRGCVKWLALEVEIVQPRIIVAMGGPAIRYFLGQDAGTVEHLHGRPVERDGRIILPAYHPASALRDTKHLRHCAEDFQVLKGLLRGESWQSFHVVDKYPNPDYRLADTPKKIKLMKDEIHDVGMVAVDTETCRGKLWSVQLSSAPGTAWFLPVSLDFQGRIDLTEYAPDALVALHNYLFDIKYVSVPDKQFVDTMVLAYLLHLPKGLKELAYRLCGVPMQTYREVVRVGQHDLALEYLVDAFGREWPKPTPIEETKWDNKLGELRTRLKNPWHISRKIKNALTGYATDETTSLWERWNNISAEERSVVEAVMGPMPEASLMDIPFEDAFLYSSRDADVTFRVLLELLQRIQEMELDAVQEMDVGILPMVDTMMRNGMAVDIEHFKMLSEDYSVRLRVKAAELAGMVGHAFNPNSSPQVAMVVYQELGFTPTKYTDTGLISTDDAELKKTGHPVAEGVIRYRGLLKLKTTYADNAIHSSRLHDDGTYRMHTVLKTTTVETGRLASAKDPETGEGANLQNIPTRNKESKNIKRGYMAPEGRVLSEVDYCQIEVCTQAHLADCKGLIELFNRGGDPHTETAARLFGVSLEEAKKDKYRYPCKRAGFGIIYLIGAKGLSTQINEYISDLLMEGEEVEIEPWDELTCEKFIADYYMLYPEIRNYQMQQAAQARRFGYVKDMFGRIRYIPEVKCPIDHIQEAGLRMAANFPVTASAQGIIKTAMCRLWEEQPDTPWRDDLRWVMQIHDSLLTELRDDDAFIRGSLTWMRDVMTGVVKLLVPVRVDFKVGVKWGDLEKYSL